MVTMLRISHVLVLAAGLTSCGPEDNEDRAGSGGADATGVMAETDYVSSGISLEQCAAEGRAWVAVVDNGARPPMCGDPLASFCCSREEVLGRFPAKSGDLAGIFARNIDADGFTLYHCSKNGPTSTTLHFGRISDGSMTTQYRSTTISRLPETDTGNASACPVVTTDDLRENQ